MAKLKEVFVAGGMPSITYVDRAAFNLERSLRSEITEGHKVICVTGPTKSGKTVLTRHILGSDKSITVNGGQVRNAEDFWSSLLMEMRVPAEETRTAGEEYQAGVRWILSAQASANEGNAQKFDNRNRRFILQYIRAKDSALVVDDFHYMPTDVQRDIIRSLKSEIFDGLTSILIAVPHRAFDAIGVEREMEGRFAHIEIPKWGKDELAVIPKKGFPELGMIVTSDTLERFAEECFGSPLLMQRFCIRLCQHYDILETVSPARQFNPSDDTSQSIFGDVAKQFGLPTFQKLSKGPQARSKRIDRETITGGEPLDIYQAVLRAVADTGPKSKIHYNEIRDQLKMLLTETAIPQKHEVSSALRHMSGIAKDAIEGEPVLEWRDDFLYLTDPFLIFYMRWAQRSSRN